MHLIRSWDAAKPKGLTCRNATRLMELNAHENYIYDVAIPTVVHDLCFHILAHGVKVPRMPRVILVNDYAQDLSGSDRRLTTMLQVFGVPLQIRQGEVA